MVESVTVPAEDKGPSLEEQAAAQDAAKAAPKDPKLAGEKPEKPEGVPEKFWNAETGEVNTEALLKSYSELEKARGKGEDNAAGEAEADAAAADAVTAAGLNMEALSSEYETNGDLTDESYDALAKVGITREMVELYLAGGEARASQVQAELLEPVGGDIAVYEEMTSWAAEALDDKSINDFNNVLESGNASAIRAAVQNLHAKYTDANGAEPGRQIAGRNGSGQGTVYESTADLMKDMQNPEYAQNPAFRAKVEAKLARSSIL